MRRRGRKRNEGKERKKKKRKSFGGRTFYELDN